MIPIKIRICYGSRFRLVRHQPITKITWISPTAHYCLIGWCLTILNLLTLSLNGVPLRLWGLYRDMDRYNSEMLKAEHAIKDLGLKLSQASDPLYIEKQALDRMDLVGENDLIFVFPNQ